MKPKGLLTAVVLLAVLGGAIWWSNKKQASASKSPTDTSTKILTIPDDQFQEIRIQKLTGEVQDLVRENGKWRMTQPKPLAADQDTVGQIVSQLAAVNADKTIEEKATDLKQYGLDDPTLDIQIKQKDGKTQELLIGDNTLTGTGAYVKLKNDAKVYTISTSVKSALDKVPNDLRDKRLMTFDQDKLSRVELNAKGQTVEFGKNAQNEWQLVKPRPLRADSSAVEGLVGKLKDAKMDLTAVEPDVAKGFAGGTKIATATVTDAGGTQTLEVRKDKDKNYYAKSSAVEGVYKVASDVGDGLDKGLDDFRNKKVFDFGFSDPSFVEAKGKGYSKDKDKWESAGKPMDNSSVQNLIDKLRDLAAAKFADKGGGTPVFDARVITNNGKRIEKVTISKLGDKYFAQRENEPSIYELDAKAVEDLQKAADDVKPAPPEAPKKK
jgi:hypothetical protein